MTEGGVLRDCRHSRGSGNPETRTILRHFAQHFMDKRPQALTCLDASCFGVLQWSEFAMTRRPGNDLSRPKAIALEIPASLIRPDPRFALRSSASAARVSTSNAKLENKLTLMPPPPPPARQERGRRSAIPLRAHGPGDAPSRRCSPVAMPAGFRMTAAGRRDRLPGPSDARPEASRASAASRTATKHCESIDSVPPRDPRGGSAHLTSNTEGVQK